MPDRSLISFVNIYMFRSIIQQTWLLNHFPLLSLARTKSEKKLKWMGSVVLDNKTSLIHKNNVACMWRLFFPHALYNMLSSEVNIILHIFFLLQLWHYFWINSRINPTVKCVWWSVKCKCLTFEYYPCKSRI